MKDLLISTDGDLLFEQNEIMMTDGIEDIIQSVRLILLTRKGEFYFDQDSGLVYENLFSKLPNFDYIKQDIVTAITEQEERVSSVDSVLFNFNKSDRKLFVSIKMTADDIPVIIEEVILNA